MSPYYKMLELEKRGEKVRCSYSGRYYHKSETVSDGKGGRVAIKHDNKIRPGKKPRQKEGPGWIWKRFP